MKRSPAGTYRPDPADRVDVIVGDILNDHKVTLHPRRLPQGEYVFGTGDKEVFVRLIGKEPLLRLGGRWTTLPAYIKDHEDLLTGDAPLPNQQSEEATAEKPASQRAIQSIVGDWVHAREQHGDPLSFPPPPDSDPPSVFSPPVSGILAAVQSAPPPLSGMSDISVPEEPGPGEQYDIEDADSGHEIIQHIDSVAAPPPPEELPAPRYDVDPAEEAAAAEAAAAVPAVLAELDEDSSDDGDLFELENKYGVASDTDDEDEENANSSGSSQPQTPVAKLDLSNIGPRGKPKTSVTLANTHAVDTGTPTIDDNAKNQRGCCAVSIGAGDNGADNNSNCVMM
jgi:Growth-Arrest-Specific Protein 2 Domain